MRLGPCARTELWAAGCGLRADAGSRFQAQTVRIAGGLRLKPEIKLAADTAPGFAKPAAVPTALRADDRLAHRANAVKVGELLLGTVGARVTGRHCRRGRGRSRCGVSAPPAVVLLP